MWISALTFCKWLQTSFTIKLKKQFTFLGLPIGSNPRSISTWTPLVKKVKDCLSCWKGRLLSLGNRITLIKSVLSSLAIFHLSFFRAPKKICLEINVIQSHFLWGGDEGRNKVHWIGWKYLCLQMKEGGLGLKNIEVFNTALMEKWKWRIINGENGKWRDLLSARYGNIQMQIQNGGAARRNRAISSW